MMQINVMQGTLTESSADALIIFTMEGIPLMGDAQEVDQALIHAGAVSVSDLVQAGDYSGKVGEVTVLHTRGALPFKRVIAVGVGKPQESTLDIARQAAALGAQKARSLKAGRIAMALGAFFDPTVIGQTIAEGVLLGLYTYTAQKSAAAPEALPHTLDLLTANPPAAEQGVNAARAIAEGVAIARDLVNAPPNVCTPDYMAQAAQHAAAETGMRLRVLDQPEMENLKMGALLGVAQGSSAPPRFIILEHNIGRADLPMVVLVGKGVTFDTGGYSMKTFEGMSTMKGDMAGGAAVIGAMRAIAALNVPLRVAGLVPAADNMISGNAYRPQDVLTASNGVTIEVVSTDAEGRLLLADALVYAAWYNPAAVVDVATLTGAAMVALGGLAGGLFVTDDALRSRLFAAAASTEERLWELPLYPEFDKMIESDVADIKNSGGRYGGASVGATFLKHFVSYPAWAHIDMAGLGLDAKDNPYVPGKGATGFGVRLLTEFVRQYAAGS